MQPTDRVHTSHVLSMTRGAMLGTKAELNFVPVNSLVMLVPGGMFLVQAISAPHHPFSLSLSLLLEFQIPLSLHVFLTTLLVTLGHVHLV